MLERLMSLDWWQWLALMALILIGWLMACWASECLDSLGESNCGKYPSKKR